VGARRRVRPALKKEISCSEKRDAKDLATESACVLMST
jgi:hypothetical protein